MSLGILLASGSVPHMDGSDIPWKVTIPLGVLGVLLSLVCWYVFMRGAYTIVRSLFLAQPNTTRFFPIVSRVKNVVVEVAAHTRMVAFRTVGIAHWFVMVGFLLGALVWFEAYIQVFDPESGWPWLKDQVFYHIIDEFLAFGTTIFIIVLIIIRQRNHPRKPERLSRFAGSNFIAAYFVEIVVLFEGLGMIFVKSGKIATFASYEGGHLVSDPLTMQVAKILPQSPLLVSLFAFIKLMSGMIWLYVVGRNINWGVAWHRFAAFFNIYFKREASGRTALGNLSPMVRDGKVMTMEVAEEVTDELVLGVGRIEDYTWKDWLDFTTCTECGRCQSQCPAWNTGKPLSPKLMIMALRDHAKAKAPYLLAGGKKDLSGEEVGLVDEEGNVLTDKLSKIPEAARLESLRSLVGEFDADNPMASGIIDPEALWSCTTCGACVEQCPVDIEHVDHFIDMRRYQVLIESEFPTELGGLFKKLEQKGNPWGQAPAARADWIKDMAFDVPVWGQNGLDSFDDTEYLFWVGCAGAYEDRAKKTTKAVAELLHVAGVKFMVLGTGETCTGDSARRAGNEFLFQMLAEQNVETLKGVFTGVPKKQRKIIVTCAHCFNTLKNEYPEAGGNYQVVHHTQLLNRLVREGRLTPIAPVEGAVTYHDPCYLGRHNHVYDEPRELVEATGSTLNEMPRHRQRSMCCGAGGARMWMEETIGKRINVDRVDEAVSTNATTIATGCPFCQVMMADGVTAREDNGNGPAAGVQVMDIAQLMHASVSRSGKMPPPRELAFLEPPIRGVEEEEEPKAADQTEEEKVDPLSDSAGDSTASSTATNKDRSSKPASAGGGLGLGGTNKAPGKAKAPGKPKVASNTPTPSASTSSPTVKAPAGRAKTGLSLGGKINPPGKAKAPGKAKLQEKNTPQGEANESELSTSSQQKEDSDQSDIKDQPSVSPESLESGTLEESASTPESGSIPESESAPEPQDTEPQDAKPQDTDPEDTDKAGSTEQGVNPPSPEADIPSSHDSDRKAPDVVGLGLRPGVKPPPRRGSRK